MPNYLKRIAFGLLAACSLAQGQPPSAYRTGQCPGLRMPICGNLDPVRDILHDTPESIRAVSEACYVEVGNPLMVNASCESPAGPRSKSSRLTASRLLGRHSLGNQISNP